MHLFDNVKQKLYSVFSISIWNNLIICIFIFQADPVNIWCLWVCVSFFTTFSKSIPIIICGFLNSFRICNYPYLLLFIIKYTERTSQTKLNHLLKTSLMYKTKYHNSSLPSQGLVSWTENYQDHSGQQ